MKNIDDLLTGAHIATALIIIAFLSSWTVVFW